MMSGFVGLAGIIVLLFSAMKGAISVKYKKKNIGLVVVFCLILFLLCAVQTSATSQCDLVYDANGNLISGFSKTFGYNDANKLVKVKYTATNKTIAEYDYDPEEKE